MAIQVNQGHTHLTATNGVNTRLQAKDSNKDIVTLKNQLGEKQTKSKSLTEESQNLRTEATQRTTTTKGKSQKMTVGIL